MPQKDKAFLEMLEKMFDLKIEYIKESIMDISKKHEETMNLMKDHITWEESFREEQEKEFDGKYAGKWVERAIIGIGGTIGAGTCAFLLPQMGKVMKILINL